MPDLPKRRAGLRAAVASGDPAPTAREQVDTLWDEVKRFDNPHTYYVDLSQKLWDIKYDLLKIERQMRRGKSTEIALCGMMTALAVVILYLGGLIPAATFCCPVLASLVLLPVMQRWGRRDAVLVWAASAILGLLLGPDKEAAALYAALGYYPAIRAGLDRKRPALRWALKLLLFNGATIALYALLIFVLGLNALVEEYRATGTALLIATLALGNVVFVIYDFLLKRLERVLAARKRRTE